MKNDVPHFVFVFACLSTGDELQNNQLSMFLTKDGMLNLPGGYSRLVLVVPTFKGCILNRPTILILIHCLHYGT